MNQSLNQSLNQPAHSDVVPIVTVRKRDGREVPYDQQRIAEALAKAGAATGEFGPQTAIELAAAARHHLQAEVMQVEDIQDVVEGVCWRRRIVRPRKLTSSTVTNMRANVKWPWPVA